MANMIIRMQFQLRGMASFFILLTFVLYFFIQFNSCSSIFLTFFGIMPVQLMLTLVTVVNAILMMPNPPDESFILQVWLQGKRIVGMNATFFFHLKQLKEYRELLEH